jgi:uncharacterized protein (DUF885 family)
MTARCSRFALLVGTVLTAACSASQHTSSAAQTHAATPAERFDAFARDYFDTRYRYNPTEATGAGVHAYDSALDDLSPDSVHRYLAWLASERDALDQLLPTLPEARPDATAPSSDRPRLDAEILRGTIQLEYVRLHDWNELATHPGAFHQMAADTVYQLMVRDFAPVDVRVRNATARLRSVPTLLAAAERWLTNPPRLAVEVALREINGSIEMVRDVFPTFAARSSNPADRDAARAAAQTAASALERHRDFLEHTLLPRANGDYHDGRARWVQRAALGEGVTESPEVIRDAALAEVHRLQADMRALSQRLARPGEDFHAVLERIRHDHPTPAQLLPAYRARQDEVRSFVRTHDLVTIDPARDDLTIVETPAFIRSTIFAALSSPGPLEQHDRHTLFYVTPADTTRPPAEIDAYLTEHSNPAIAVTSIHEAYPGHHVQGIHQRQAHSLVRQILWQGSYGEGWAHYCEQMIVDEGFGDDAIRFDERQEALLRAARAYLDVSIHVFGASYEDAVRFYRDEAFMSQPGAEMEAKRVSLAPASVFIYTYGKFAIYRLRNAVVDHATGAHPTLAQFHNALLDFGSAPLPRIARSLYAIDLPAWNPNERPFPSIAAR